MSRESLDGKRALVTAGASGIGRAIAETLRDAGARVAVCDIDQSALDRMSSDNAQILCLPCDVADAVSVEAVVETVINEMGGIDILVNNAGTSGPTAFIEAIEPTDWDSALRVNLTAQFLFIRSAVQFMKAQKDGLIVNMSSAAGRLGMPLRTPYVAAKWGVIGLTQSLAMELGADNIRVNAILPGSVKGERMDRVMQARASATGLPLEEIEQQETAAMSLGRLIDPEEIADLVAYLASKSGRSISGQSLGVCGNTETLR